MKNWFHHFIWVFIYWYSNSLFTEKVSPKLSLDCPDNLRGWFSIQSQLRSLFFAGTVINTIPDRIFAGIIFNTIPTKIFAENVFNTIPTKIFAEIAFYTIPTKIIAEIVFNTIPALSCWLRRRSTSSLPNSIWRDFAF